MNDVICLNPDYSTTRRLTSISSAVRETSNVKFEHSLGLVPKKGLAFEGGLRTNGYFKLIAFPPEYGGLSMDLPRQPLITVITAVFNAERTLEQTILSVIGQSYDNIEFIIVDGGSTDGSLDIIRKYEHAIDYWISEPDAGIYDAWNKGVQLASGDWIAFLGADDTYRDGAIQTYVSFIADRRENELEYISSQVNLVDHSEILRVVGTPWIWSTFRKYMNVAHVGSMHHRSLFERYGLFDRSYRISGDYEFLLRSGQGLKADFLNAVTVNMLVGGVSDANILVFKETTRAKIITGKRNRWISHIEKYWAIVKWKIRSYLRS